MDFSRLRNGELIAAIGGVLLFVFMFFDWFSAGGAVPDIAGSGQFKLDVPGLSAWDALQDFDGFLIALAAVSGVVLGVLAAAGQRVNLPLPRGAGTASLGSLAVLLILWRMLANPGDLKIGIFLGLAAAVAIAVGAILSLREDGIEPLVAVAGRRTRAASSASAPAAKPAARKTTTTRKKPASSRTTKARKK